ncbi:MAG: hypothetical protein LQ343_002073 [Gyalolechia ehrenbergii]|nr:MAG: hypothetical protein LQ343_002073 [Gyalolechia ehrenbergii]
MILRQLFPLLLSTPSSWCAADSNLQRPLRGASVISQPDTQSPVNAKTLHGRFLHITDLHPDRFYSFASSTDDDDACHWGEGSAGIFGAEKTDCDSPITLVNATFQWINDNLKGSIDFVVWTGDSARHDNDELIPRTEEQVVDLNSLLVEKFVEVFGKDDNINDTDPTNDFTIPIVPNFGNNDILPHNIFTKGPNRWTKTFAHVWRKFIPEEQTHAFERGGWFFVEVIPNQLAVFSLNTLYFFNSNVAVNGCADESEPGYEQFEWLRIQLQFLRQRDMKAILMGHVPPARTASKQSWDETCWQKYALWLQQYRDIVIGGLYGHMNIDHFMLQDREQIDMKILAGEMQRPKKPQKSEDFFIQSSAQYLTELRHAWSQLPGKVKAETIKAREASEGSKKVMGRKSKHGKFLDSIGGEWGERYSATLVGASIVPNYYPTMRVFEYNTTALHLPTSNGQTHQEQLSSAGFDQLKKHRKSGKSKKHGLGKPKPPSRSSPPGPAYSPQTLSLLSYTQYFANLTRINAAFVSPGKSPIPKFNYELEYDTRNDTIYGLSDLTVRSYIDLAARIGKYKPGQDLLSDAWEDVEDNPAMSKKKKHHKKRKAINKLWYTFVNRAYVGAKDDEELRDQFGFTED